MNDNVSVVIIMGSGADREHCAKIKKTLDSFGITSVMRVASAHKTPLKVLDIIKDYQGKSVVFITVAGRSNALSGFVDASTTRPVIACPPYSDKFSGMDILSSLRMPSGVAPLTTLEPEQAALAAVKILALHDASLIKKIHEYQEEHRKAIEQDDEQIQHR